MSDVGADVSIESELDRLERIDRSREFGSVRGGDVPIEYRSDTARAIFDACVDGGLVDPERGRELWLEWLDTKTSMPVRDWA